jgi:alginate O-acetyltransferase complex protein AlgI
MFRIVGGVVVFFGVCVGWVFFRAKTFSDAGLILNRISEIQTFDMSQVPQKFHVVKGLIIITSVLCLEAFSLRWNIWEIAAHHPLLIAAFLLGSLLAISLLGTFHGTAFIYFQF